MFTVLAWVIVGLGVSAFAACLGKGKGYRTALDTTAGLVGALTGGFLAVLLEGGNAGLGESILAALLGACLFIPTMRLVAPIGKESRGEGGRHGPQRPPEPAVRDHHGAMGSPHDRSAPPFPLILYLVPGEPVVDEHGSLPGSGRSISEPLAPSGPGQRALGGPMLAKPTEGGIS